MTAAKETNLSHATLSLSAVESETTGSFSGLLRGGASYVKAEGWFSARYLSRRVSRGISGGGVGSGGKQYQGVIYPCWTLFSQFLKLAWVSSFSRTKLIIPQGRWYSIHSVMHIWFLRNQPIIKWCSLAGSEGTKIASHDPTYTFSEPEPRERLRGRPPQIWILLNSL